MNRLIFVTLCGVCLLLIESATSLKCKTGQQADDQLRKIVQMCKKRYKSDDSSNYSDNSSSDNDEDNDEDSDEDSENDDSSNMDVFDTRFFMSGDSRSSNAQSWRNQNSNRNRGNNQRNDQRHSFNHTNDNWRSEQYPNHGGNRDSGYSDGNGRMSHRHNGNSRGYNREQDQTCAIQCFFNELNVVDQRGFPEQDLIVQLMTQNVYNPELQDFVQEAIVECFHYLSSDMKQDKCRFSQDLLTCLADKGKERCEDWD